MQLAEIVRGLPQIRLPSLGLSALVVGGVLLLDRFAPRVPGPLIAVVGAIAASAAWNFAGHGIDVIGPVVGGLPHLGLPAVNWKDIEPLIPIAGSCFVMIVAQSAATARIYAVRHQQPSDENADLAGLSAANAAAALSGTFVVNGSPTQTAMAERCGGQSQMTHVAAAVVVSLVLLFLTGPFQYLPRCVLGAIVFLVAIHLTDLRGLRAIRQESPGEFWLALTTAAVVVLVGVEQGIILAMVLSLLRIVHHSYRPHTAVLVQDKEGIWELTPVVPGAVTEPGLVVYRFGAPLFYANAGMFADEVRRLAGPFAVRWLIVDAGAITNVDYTAAHVVRELLQDLANRGVALVFAHVQSDLKPDLDRHRLTEAIGPDRLFDTLHEALATYPRDFRVILHAMAGSAYFPQRRRGHAATAASHHPPLRRRPNHPLDQHTHLLRIARQRHRHSAGSSASLLGRNRERGNSLAHRFAAPVRAGRPIRLGPVAALSLGVVLHFEWAALRTLRHPHAAFPVETFRRLLQRPSANRLLGGCRHSVSSHNLDRPRHVPRHHVGFPRACYWAWRPAICPHHSFLYRGFSCSLSSRPRHHGLSRRIYQTRACHDYWKYRR